MKRVRVRAQSRLRPHQVPAEATARDDIPIFLLGTHRSGTSLLRRIVDSHSRLACPAETLWLEHLAAAVGGRDAADGLSAVGLTPKELSDALRPIAEGAFRRWAHARGKRRWADKSPTVLHQLDGLDTLFGERAQYVALLRSGLDVAASLGGATPVWWQLEPYLAAAGSPYAAAATYWRDLTSLLLDFADLHRDRVHVLRYEDLVRDPAGVLRPMFTFLGEPWEPDVVQFNRHPHDGGLEDHHVSTTTTIEDQTGKHRTLPAAVQAEMWRIVRDAMVRGGYPDREPGT